MDPRARSGHEGLGEMHMEPLNLKSTGSLNDHPLLDSPPPGFQVVRLGEDFLTIRYRQTEFGCGGVFFSVWLAGWTIGCIMGLSDYLRGTKMTDGTPIPLWQVGIFWLAEVVVGRLFITWLFERRSFQIRGDTLTIDGDLLGRITRTVVSRASITSVRQVKDGEDWEIFPSLDLCTNTEKSHKLLRRPPREQSAWLGQVIADWAGTKFEVLPK